MADDPELPLDVQNRIDPEQSLLFFEGTGTIIDGLIRLRSEVLLIGVVRPLNRKHCQVLSLVIQSEVVD